MDKKSVIIGVEGLVIAEITAEGSSSTTYDTIESIPGVIEVGLTANTSMDQLGADDNPTYEVMTSLDSVELSLNVASLDSATYAKLLGHTYNATTGVVTQNKNDAAPYFAVGFEAKKADGTGRKIWLLRGKFAEGDETFHTKEQGSVNWQTPNITATFGARLHDGNLRMQLDSDDTNTSSSYATFLSTVPA